MPSTLSTPAQVTAQAFLRSLNDGGTGLIDLIHPKGLVQHNPTLADGFYGLAMALHDCGAKPPRFDVLFSFEAEPYVVLVCTRDAFGFHVGVELLRLEDGLIREHWDNYGVAMPSLIRPLRAHLAALAAALRSGEGAIARARAQGMVSAFVTEAVIQRQVQARWHVAPGVYQEWQVATGQFVGTIREHASAPAKPWMFRQVRLHGVISDGHWALAVSEGRSGSHATCHFDLFALQGSGIVFRLPIDELVPLPNFHRHPNGKFGNFS